MVEKRFWAEPYRTELATRLRTVEGNDVTVEQTIAYAFSGGQESDAGTIGGAGIVSAAKRERDIVYTLAEGHGLQAGQEVLIRIDWDRRYRLMRLHFAAELILEIVTRALPGIVKIGAHIAADKARIDFAWPESLAPRYPEWLAEAERLIEADHAIVSAFADEAAQRRYWEVEGFARVPCGGTHLRRTGEVGRIALKRNNIGKGKERVEIRLVS